MLTFYQQIKTHNGSVAGVEIIPIKHDVGANTKVTKKKMQISRSKNVNDLHRELGHPSEATTRATGASMGIKVVGKFEPCKACNLGKAKQRNINKTTVEHTTVPGKRLYLDISSPNTASLSGKKYWLLIVNDATGYIWSYFLKYTSNFT